MGYRGNDFDRNCLDEEENESVRHLPCDYSARFVYLEDVPLKGIKSKERDWFQHKVNSSE